ncbi:hypothetical protein F4806DRAFT_6305 [Annulohypoxylon nitens]|nr:hypothetical protein F4806DRAFT_6305 [Annulohypoxylon nitens]
MGTYLPTVLICRAKDNLRFHRDPHNLQPYIPHESFKATLVDKGTSTLKADKADNCMLVLGVLLRELLSGDVMERHEFRSCFLDDKGQPNEYTDLCVAMKWQEKAEREHGSEIADAIRRCILCSFEPAPDLENSTFIRAVWQGVGVPIEQFLKAWTYPATVC